MITQSAAAGDGTSSILDYTVETSEMDSSKHGTFTINKTFNCIVVSPLGESLHRFETVSELLQALRDAIKAHRSLYQDGGILHRDICPGNIIVPSYGLQRKGASPKGVIIDLDVAKEVTEPSKQFEGVGTPPFQAIGVLQAYLPNNPHTYRHDLESFFYTFLFLAICQRPVPPGENQLQLPPTSILHQWTIGRPIDQVRRKTSDMDVSNFHHITGEFTTEFKGLTGLAENLREILFPMKNGKLWTGTDMTTTGTNTLYDSMINASDMTIAVGYSL
jgi:serine/threonine protein kinase